MADSHEALEPESAPESDTPAPLAPEPEGSTAPQAAEPELNPEPAVSDPVGSDAPASTPPGWYPDPNAGGANLMRYWDGGAWTDRVQGGSEVSTTRRTADERKVILSQQLQTAAARGLRIESQSDFQ